MISFIHSLFALLFRGAFLLLMLLIFLLICFNFLFFKIFLPAFLPCLFLKNLGGSCWLVCLVAVTCMPWSSCLGGWCLVGSWLVCPLLMYLGACVLLVGVLGGGYLHALNLVFCWLVSLVGVSWLVCPLLMYLVARALVVRVGWKWLPGYLEPCVPGWCPW